MVRNPWVRGARAAGWAFLVAVGGVFALTALLLLTSVAAPAGDPDGSRWRFGLFGVAVLAAPVALGVVTGVLLVRRPVVAYALVVVESVLCAALWTFGVVAGGTTSNRIVSAVCLALALAAAVAGVMAVRAARADPYLQRHHPASPIPDERSTGPTQRPVGRKGRGRQRDTEVDDAWPDLAGQARHGEAPETSAVSPPRPDPR